MSRLLAWFRTAWDDPPELLKLVAPLGLVVLLVVLAYGRCRSPAAPAVVEHAAIAQTAAVQVVAQRAEQRQETRSAVRRRDVRREVRRPDGTVEVTTSTAMAVEGSEARAVAESSSVEARATETRAETERRTGPASSRSSPSVGGLGSSQPSSPAQPSS